MTEIAAKGTTLGIGDGGGPEAFTVIAQVRDIQGPSLAMDTIDTSHHSSTDHWRTYVAGLKDGGEITLDLLFDPVEATHIDSAGGLLDDFDSRTLRNFELTFSDAATTTWTIAAFVTGFTPGAPHDAELSASVTLKVSGEPTLA